MKVLRAVICFAVALVATAGSVRAQLVDPADIHLFSNHSFSQSAGGTDWVTLDQFDATFSVEDVSANGTHILPWHIVFAIPNQTGTLLDAITKIGTTSVNISPGPEVILTSGSAYDALGLSGAPGSVSFSNFVTADTAVGLPAPTSYGLNDFTIAGLALLGNKTALDVQLSGLLPKGTVIFAYGEGDDSKLYTTAFTNAGVVVPLISSVPEPATLVSAGIGTLCLLGYVAWQRRLRKANASGLAVSV